MPALRLDCYPLVSLFCDELWIALGGVLDEVESAFVVFILVLFRPTLATGSLLVNAAPGIISLSTSASPAPATSALGLKGAAHFIAIDRS
jgi:hypothetical protein